MATHYIGADVDCRMVNLAVERGGKIVQEFCVPTTIPALREVLESVPRPRELAIEEGPMAHWLYRNLSPHVDKMVVCDPRRNGLISNDGDSDDRIDGRKLATLLRGGYMREVYHGQDDAQVGFKRWVGLYHDRVHAAVREINKIRGHSLQYGHRPPRKVLHDLAGRKEWLLSLGSSPLAGELEMLFVGLDSALRQAKMARREMLKRGQEYPIAGLWQELPGVGVVRSLTMLAYLDTPWRFGNNPHKLWVYCGVGLQRSSSGKDRFGRMKIGKLQLAWRVNRRLKDAVMGAAISAIRQGDNAFARQYRRLMENGLAAGNARHTVARKMVTVMWGMWKTMKAFDPKLV
jgi:transposase